MAHEHTTVGTRGDSAVGNAYRRFASMAALALLPAFFSSGVAQSAWAGSSGQLCIKEKIGGNPPCTANDVRISSLMAAGGTITCMPGDSLNLTLTATVESGPDRYDIGVWVNETGGSALSDPGGTCYRDYLHPVSTNNVGCSQMYPGPYFNGETGRPNDHCGDVPATGGAITCGATIGPCTGGGGTCLFSTYSFTATFECADSNNDGIADLGTCTSWDNNTNTDCTNELNTDPGTGSKCNCGNVGVGNIFIDPCVSANCSDGNSCTVDTCDSTSGSAVCSHTPNNSLCNDGQFCNGVETCNVLTGCQAGTPPNCADSVTCTVDTCNETTDSCDHTPNNGACSNGLFCDGTETCSATLGCQPGTPPNCNDGVACSVDACNEATDSCDHTPNNASCSNGLFCDGTETCNATLGCQPGTPPNCNDSVACSVDACNEATDSCDHTPNNASCSNGLFCDGNETCSATLGCQPGTAPNCNDGVACTVDACNETFDTCDHTPNNGACSNGLFCDGTEICNATLGCQPGTAVNCADGVACTVDACNEATDSCDHTPNNASCSNGLFCDGNEICNATLGCQPGTAVTCTDGVACTVDACNEATDACDHTPNNASCSNGLFCDGNEICNATLGCQPGTAVNCTDGIACTVDACNEATDACDHTPNNLSCTDGLFCSGIETCDPVNGCEPGGDPCPGTQCDEVNDVCFGCTLDAECDNGLFCDGAETCGMGGICQPGTPPNCNDGVACTTDACNEATDSCDHTPSNASCSNGLFCDGNEICNVTLGCQPGTPVNCTDGVACTVDACNEATDSCDHTPNNASCSNGLFCDGNEICNVTLGCQPGIAPNCNDAVACTTDACNEGTDSCDHTPNNASCSDGLFCDGIETCNVTLGCQPGIAPNCNDAVACTADSCNETNAQCDHAPSNAACSDSQFCTGIETCNVTLGCQPGIAPNCNDPVSCTADTCNETFDNCDHTPNNVACSDGLACTLGETCDPLTGCRPGTPKTCPTDTMCTVYTCQEPTAQCVAQDLCCGNGVVDPGEECEPAALPGEICDDMIDNDGDDLIDCLDPDCSVTGCKDDCTRFVCTIIEKDPAVIKVNETEDELGYVKIHGRVVVDMAAFGVDFRETGFGFLLLNADGSVLEDSVDGNGFIRKGFGRYMFKDKAAVHLGGLAQVRTKLRLIDDKPYLSFAFTAYGDTRAATLPVMTTMVYGLDDVGVLTAKWARRTSGWSLRPSDY